MSLGSQPRRRDLLVMISPTAPTSELRPWLEAIAQSDIDKVDLLGAEVVEVETRTMGVVRDRYGCARRISLSTSEGGEPLSRFATWADVYAASRSGGLVLNPSK